MSGTARFLVSKPGEGRTVAVFLAVVCSREPSRKASAKETMMTKFSIGTYREKLLALRERIVGDASQLQDEALHTSGSEASGNLSHVPIHPADLGTDNFE